MSFEHQRCHQLVSCITGMEHPDGLASIVRKKRSSVSRRPLPDSKLLSDSYHILPLQSAYSSGTGGYGENRSLQNSNVASSSAGESKPKKLKLKFGGVTHTIHTKSTAELGSSYSNAAELHDQDNIDVKHYGSSVKDKGSQGFRRTIPSVQKQYISRGNSSWDASKIEQVRKSKRVPKRRVMDVGFNENDEEDAEIRYLGRLGASKSVAREDGRHIFFNTIENRGGSSNDDRKMARCESSPDDEDYAEEIETVSDEEPGPRNKKLKKGSTDFTSEEKSESVPTTRNRALQYGIDVSVSRSSVIEFPNGLPPAAPKKQKEKLTEVEQQLKRAEAAQRRRMQAEKAAREAEADAIRKILGQDSARKKREKEIKKQQERLEKDANGAILPSNTIRLLLSPSGTVVTFSEDIGLPSLFNPSPCSYPPPREKCAGPNCTNEYKYRDSKSKLPLCSLRCYKAMQHKSELIISC